MSSPKNPSAGQSLTPLALVAEGKVTIHHPNSTSPLSAAKLIESPHFDTRFQTSPLQSDQLDLVSTSLYIRRKNHLVRKSQGP